MKRYYTIAFLILINLIVFGQTITFEFVDYDDQVYILENPQMEEGLSWSTIKWGLTTDYFVSWHPVTWWSFLLDAEVYGINAWGFHATNVIIHILATIFLFYALFRMTDRYWESLIVAVLFAIHPQHVQSVAWISERKDVLSALFMSLTFLAYHRYTQDQRPRWYLLTMFMFALGLMSKSMLVTLPCVLFLLDYWPLNRLGDWQAIKRAILEKIPLMAMSIGTAFITFILQDDGGAMTHMGSYSFLGRVVNALNSYVVYLYRCIWPVNLSFFYPLDFNVIPVTQGVLSALFLLLVSVLVWRKRTQAPQMLVGWLWYLGTLVPVIGLVQVGVQANADRYTYIPLIGIFIAVVFTLHPWLQLKHLRKRVAKMAYAVVLVSLMLMSFLETGFWHNTGLLTGRAVNITEDNHIAYFLLGNIHVNYKSYDQAEKFYRKSLEISPESQDVRMNLSLLLEDTGRLDEAEALLLETQELYPKEAKIFYSLARVAQLQGDMEKTNIYYIKHANILWQVGDLEAALKVYDAILEKTPDSVLVLHNKASALFVHERVEEALPLVQEVLRLDPDYEPAQNLLAAINATSGNQP